MVDRRKLHNHLLSRTLRARDNGAADEHPLLARREAPHNQRIKPTPGGKAYGSPALRGLSAAPLGFIRRNYLNFVELPHHTQFFLCFVGLLTLYFHFKYGEKSLTYGPTILTTTGIFATFLGIALGLADFDTANIQASVPALLSGLKTAFWASVAGVGGALTIKFRHFFIGAKQEVAGTGVDGEVTASDLAKLLQSIQQALVGSDDSTLVSQLKLSRQDTNDRLDALKKAQQEALLKLSEMSSKALVEALRDVIKDFNNKLTDQFGDNFKQLNEAVGKLLVWQEQYKIHIETVTKGQAEIIESMKIASENYQKLVTEAARFTAVSSDLSSLLTALETQKKQLGSLLKALADLLQSASGSLPEIEKKIMELTEQLTRSVENNQKETNKALMENSQLIRASIQEVGQDLDKINQKFNKHLGELAEKTNKQVSVVDSRIVELTQRLITSVETNQKEVGKALAENVQLIRTSIQGTEKDFAKINQEFNKHLGELAEKTNKQISALDAALAEELKKSLESLGRQLAALSEKFVSDYSPLAEKLREVVNIAKRLQ